MMCGVERLSVRDARVYLLEANLTPSLACGEDFTERGAPDLDYPRFSAASYASG